MLGLLRARSGFPEIVGNIKKRKVLRMEALEQGLVLAKHVLPQLSYRLKVGQLQSFSDTPTSRASAGGCCSQRE